MKRSSRAHIVALSAAFVTFVVICALWIISLRLGPPPAPLVAGAAAVMVPLALLVMSAIWFFIRAAMHGRMQWRVITVLSVTIVVPLVIVTMYCGPIACYAAGPPNHMLGEFIIGGSALIAIVHHLVLNRYPAEPEDGR